MYISYIHDTSYKISLYSHDIIPKFHGNSNGLAPLRNDLHLKVLGPEMFVKICWEKSDLSQQLYNLQISSDFEDINVF